MNKTPQGTRTTTEREEEEEEELGKRMEPIKKRQKKKEAEDEASYLYNQNDEDLSPEELLKKKRFASHLYLPLLFSSVHELVLSCDHKAK